MANTAAAAAAERLQLKRNPCGHLLMSLGELLQVVLQEGDLLFVGSASLGILRVQVVLHNTQFDFTQFSSFFSI